MSDNARKVYSTAHGETCPTCGWPMRDCKCSRSSRRSLGEGGSRLANEPLPARIHAKLRLEKKGRGGKAVTVVYDLPNNDTFLKSLAGELKRACGTGGTAVERGVEIQGDVRERLRPLLLAKGWMVKG